MKEILVGADPEVFLFQNGKPISVYGMIPGTKESPHPVKDGAIQVDGLAAEFNINPAKDEQEFLGNIKSVMSQLSTFVEGELKAVPVAEFGKEYIDSQPFEAKVLGCTPDYNAWTMTENPIPDGNADFRTGAGHVHVGIDLQFSSDKMRFVRQLDGYLGLNSLLWDSDSKRRQLYGKAGAFRMKPYGVEYRTLSNAWLNDEETIIKVFKLTKMAAMDFLSGKHPFEKYGENIVEVINNSLVDIAKNILLAEGLLYEKAV